MIELENVSYWYVPEHPVIRKVSAVIREGRDLRTPRSERFRQDDTYETYVWAPVPERQESAL